MRVALAFITTMPTNVYIDGFNLYYGSVKGTPFKWLDLGALCQRLLPAATIHRIRYFTARVSPSPDDPGAATRQDVYIRALRTIPNISIHFGHFVRWPRLMPQYPLAYPHGVTVPQAVQVLKTEEKGSDVNLGVYLVRDCFVHDFTEAVIISNDSDLAEAVRIVASEGCCPVKVINPHRHNRISRELCTVSSSQMASINSSALRACQFSSSMTDSVGVFSKPPSW